MGCLLRRLHLYWRLLRQLRDDDGHRHDHPGGRVHSGLPAATRVCARRLAEAASQDRCAARTRCRTMNAAALIQAVTERFAEAVTASHAYRGDATVLLRREWLLRAARALKEDPAFQMNLLMDL